MTRTEPAEAGGLGPAAVPAVEGMCCCSSGSVIGTGNMGEPKPAGLPVTSVCFSVANNLVLSCTVWFVIDRSRRWHNNHYALLLSVVRSST